MPSYRRRPRCPPHLRRAAVSSPAPRGATQPVPNINRHLAVHRLRVVNGRVDVLVARSGPPAAQAGGRHVAGVEAALRRLGVGWSDEGELGQQVVVRL